MSKKIINSIENFNMNVNQSFVDKAEALTPKLYEEVVAPISVIKISKNDKEWFIENTASINSLPEQELSKGHSVCVDFGNHHVGWISFSLVPVGSPPDAPAHLRIKLGESLCEIGEDAKSYEGSISSSWIQEEYIHVDILPNVILLPRRYAFRYIEITVLDTSPKYNLKINNIKCRTVTSADISSVELYCSADEKLVKIDQIALKTMQDCMQSVFEDGPKRDRRLWLGDLRLQAITNYVTFKNNDLVKRCLYLFAGLTQNEGSVGACLFIEPTMQVDDTYLFDYSLLFVSCLYDYYQATGDIETLRELWDTALKQIQIAYERLNEDGIVKDSDDWWCFIDWNDDLNKQASAQGVLIYTLRHAVEIAQILNDTEQQDLLSNWINLAVNGAKQYLWDENKSFFLSGSKKQISWASQIWLVLANVFSKEKNKEILNNLIETNPSIGIVTPYLYHHLVDALIANDNKDKAIEVLKYYWGAMVDEGADCFWELFDPNNRQVSPYGSMIINSYCHAWSCTPSYFLRKYFDKGV